MTANLRRAAGSLMVVGLSGTELTGLERAWLKVVRPGGVILFRRNIADAQQTRGLLAEATALCAENTLRCVDVEGGTVDRLRDALAPSPSAQAVAVAARKSANPLLAREHGELIGRGVRAFGFNGTLAPVLDLALPESAGVMGTRAVGATADEVVAYAREFLAGLAKSDVWGCGKHFPGLGGGTRDSHFETPQIDRDWKRLWREDVTPYRQLAADLPMVMVNHAAYPNTPAGTSPATSSRFWISDVLRRRVKYRGLILSDDMEMGGILKFMPMEEAAVTAVRAGMDMIEICHSPELILRAYEALVSEAETSSAFRSILLRRAGSVAALRKSLPSGGESSAASTGELADLREKILRFRERVSALSDEVPTMRDGGASGAPIVETA